MEEAGALERQGSLFAFIAVQHTNISPEEKPDMDWLPQKFYDYGVLVGTYPKVVAFCALIVLILLAPGVTMIESETELPPLFLAHSQNVYKDWKYLDDNFERPGGRGEIIAMGDSRDFNMLEPEILRSVVRNIDHMVHNASIVYNGENYEWKDVCFEITPGNCNHVIGIFNIWGHDENSIPNTLEEVLEDINVDPVVTYNKDQFNYGNSLQRISFDSNNNVAAANVLHFYYFFAAGLELNLINKFLEEISGKKPSPTPNYKVIQSNDFLWEEEIAEGTNKLMQGTLVSSFIVAFYTMWVLGGTALVHGNKTVVAACLISVIFATVCAFGLAGYVGEKWSSTLFVPIILLLGLGLDDTFVLTNDYYQQYIWARHLLDEEKANGGKQSIGELYPIPERFGNMMALGGFSIFVTSVTDMVVFAVGYFLTDIPIVKTFCLICGVGVVFDFFFQVTFFLTILYLDALRQDANRVDCCCCFVAEDPNATCCGGEVNIFQSNTAQRLLGRYLPDLVLTKVGMVIVFIISLVLFAFSIAALPQIEPYWDLTSNYKDGGQMKTFIEIFFSEPSMIIHTEFVIEAESFVQSKSQIDAMIADVNNQSNIVNPEGWYYKYNQYLNLTGQPFPSTDTALVASVKTYLNTSQGSYDFQEIVFDGDERISHSKINCQILCGFDYFDIINAYKDNQAVVEDHEDDNLMAFLFNHIAAFYISNAQIIYQTLTAVAIGIPIIVCIVYLMVRHVRGTFYVLFMVIMTDIDVIGICYYLDIDFDFFFGLCILIALGQV